MKSLLKNISNIFFVLLAGWLIVTPAKASDIIINNPLAENLTKAITNFRARPAFFNKAKLVAVADKALTVDYNKSIYKILINEQTRLMRRYGGVAKLEEFKANQLLLISGKRISPDTIEAKYIFNWSIEKYQGAYVGVIDSISLDNAVVILKTTSRGPLTIRLEEGSKILHRNDEKSLADLVVGAKVVVTGLWDKQAKTITEIQKIVVLIMPSDKSVGVKQKIKQEIVSFGREIRQIETTAADAISSLINK